MKRMNLSGAGVLASVLLLFTPVLYADCSLYDAAQFQGASRVLGAGERLGSLGASWDNHTSSANITENCKLTLYSDANFKGESKVLSASSPYLGSLWDNQASSAICACTAPPEWAGRRGHGGYGRERWGEGRRPPPPPPVRQSCRAYRDMNFGGGELALAANNSYSVLGFAMNDQISSVKVPQGCSLTVYSHEGLDGRNRVFLEGDYNYVGERWDDRISSAACACR